MTFMDAQASFQTQSRTGRVEAIWSTGSAAVAAPGLAGHQAWRYRRSVLGAVPGCHRHGRPPSRGGCIQAVSARLAARAPALRHSGLIVWNLISAAIWLAAEVFVANGLIKQLRHR